jgi:hypothetical protein
MRSAAAEIVVHQDGGFTLAKHYLDMDEKAEATRVRAASETRHAYRLDSASRSAAARASSMSVWVVNRTRRPSADQQMAHPSR